MWWVITPTKLTSNRTYHREPQVHFSGRLRWLRIKTLPIINFIAHSKQRQEPIINWPSSHPMPFLRQIATKISLIKICCNNSSNKRKLSKKALLTMTTMTFAQLSLTTILMIRWIIRTLFRKNCRFSTIKTTSWSECSHPWSKTLWLIKIKLLMAHKWQRVITWLIVRCKTAIVSRTWPLAEICNTLMHQVGRRATDGMCKQRCAQQLQITWPMAMIFLLMRRR